MSIKGFKMSDGTVKRYDYSALENIETDNTLSRSGVAADGKAVGDELTNLKEDLEQETMARENLESTLNGIGIVVVNGTLCVKYAEE